MACETMRQPQQTIQERVAEVKASIAALEKLLGRKKVRVKVGPQGAITFDGWTAEDRRGITDACAFRRIMATGGALARMEIANAERLAGRSVDRRIVAQGTHSHDGGQTWHSKG